MRIELLVGGGERTHKLEHAGRGVHGVPGQANEGGAAQFHARIPVSHHQNYGFGTVLEGLPHFEQAGSVGLQGLFNRARGDRRHEAGHARLTTGFKGEGSVATTDRQCVNGQGTLRVSHFEGGVLEAESHRVHPLQGHARGGGVAVKGVALHRSFVGGQLTAGARGLPAAFSVQPGILCSANDVELAVQQRAFKVAAPGHVYRERGQAHGGAQRANSHGGVVRAHIESGLLLEVSQGQFQVQAGRNRCGAQSQHTFTVYQAHLIVGFGGVGVGVQWLEVAAHGEEAVASCYATLVQYTQFQGDGSKAVSNKLLRNHLERDRASGQEHDYSLTAHLEQVGAFQ